MLTAEGCALRRERLWQALPAPCDLLIISAPEHLIYFANFVLSPFEFRTTEATALLVLPAPGESILVADNLLRSFSDRAHVGQVEAPLWYQGRESADHRRALAARAALDVIGRKNLGRVGLEMASAPAGLVEGIRALQTHVDLIDLDPIIRPLRRAKDPDELELIRRSIRAGEAGHAAALDRVRPGMTEYDVFRLVQEAAADAAGEPVIIYGDFISGLRAARERSGPPSSRRLEWGDLLLLDYSVVIGGYRGDLTNTFAVGSDPTPRQVMLFEACLDALHAGEVQLRPGCPARDVDAAVRRSFEVADLGSYYVSHTGHGLGLGHPDPPYLVPESNDTLTLGDVVALEPGLYIPDAFGMRYEHNYVITADGFERLSGHALTIRAPSV
jgi:Xaa-Pro aminopeptidase